MRRLTVVSATLLTSAMIAGTAAAERFSESGQCKVLEIRLERCDSGARLSRETRASCDRIEEGFRALCGPLEIIFASTSAESAALDLLDQDYEVVPIEDANGDAFPNHVVIGPSDLDDPEAIALLREAHRVGKTVAIANATQDEARSFHRLVRAGQDVNCAPPNGQREIELYGLQQSVTRTPPQISSFCLLSLDDGGAAADRRWLRERFGPTPPQPAAGEVGLEDSSASLSGLATDSTAFLSELVERWLGGRPARAQTTSDQFLSDLSTATHCSYKYVPTADETGEFEMDLYIYSMRVFTDSSCASCETPGADYYLVQANVTFVSYFGNPGMPGAADHMAFVLKASGLSEVSTGDALDTEFVGLEFEDPQTTTTFESSYTNSSSTTVSGSVGVNPTGPNVTAGGSVTAGQSMTYMVPPTTILNQSDIDTAVAQWQFNPQDAVQNADFDVNPTWTWFVPQDAYPSGGTGSGQITFTAFALVGEIDAAGTGYSSDSSSSAPCNVSYPFSAWTVAPPQLSSLDPTSTEIDGGQFTITGEFLYPSSVTAVLIGGVAIPLGTNVDLSDDTTIAVTVPSNLGLQAGTSPVEVQTEYNGENRASNTLDLTLTD